MRCVCFLTPHKAKCICRLYIFNTQICIKMYCFILLNVLFSYLYLLLWFAFFIHGAFKMFIYFINYSILIYASIIHFQGHTIIYLTVLLCCLVVDLNFCLLFLSFNQPRADMCSVKYEFDFRLSRSLFFLHLGNQSSCGSPLAVDLITPSSTAKFFY